VIQKYEAGTGELLFPSMNKEAREAAKPVPGKYDTLSRDERWTRHMCNS